MIEESESAIIYTRKFQKLEITFKYTVSDEPISSLVILGADLSQDFLLALIFNWKGDKIR